MAAVGIITALLLVVALTLATEVTAAVPPVWLDDEPLLLLSGPADSCATVLLFSLLF